MDYYLSCLLAMLLITAQGTHAEVYEIDCWDLDEESWESCDLIEKEFLSAVCYNNYNHMMLVLGELHFTLNTEVSIISTFRVDPGEKKRSI